MKKRQSGFTLIEMMVTVAVGIIVLGIGIPAVMNLMSSNQATACANEIIGALRLARSEAVKRGDGVTVCPSNATNSACSGSDWQNGWLVFTDPGNDRTYTVGTDTLIRVWQAPGGTATFSGAPTSVRFLASGELNGSATSFAFKLDGCTGDQARTIAISKMGRASATTLTCF